MGRAERRRQERAKRIQDRKSKILMRPDEIRQMKRDLVDQIATYDVDVLLTCFAQVLHDQYGWGRVRILRALTAVDDMFGRVLSDELNVQEMQARLADEVGIRINTKVD